MNSGPFSQCDVDVFTLYNGLVPKHVTICFSINKNVAVDRESFFLMRTLLMK